MANPIIRGFGQLARFSGRDLRGQFWPYAAAVLAIVFVLSGAAMAWVMADIFAEMQAFAMAHPEAATVTSGPGQYSIQIDAGQTGAPMPDPVPFFGTLAVTVLLAVGLLAAAVSRRLHDSGRSAYWGLLPLPFLLFGLGAFPMMMADFTRSPEPDMGLFFALFLNNIIYMAALATLVVLLAQRGTAGPNKYGEAP
jgi:uncharacterized membrane protein YhaH (DUF805 family)